MNRLSFGAEVLYRRILNVVDDYGRFHASPTTLRAACWPTCPERVTDADVLSWLGECKACELVKLFEVDGCRYLEIQSFRQPVRAAKSKFPQPGNTCVSSASHVQSTGEADGGQPLVICDAHDTRVHVMPKANEISLRSSKCVVRSAKFAHAMACVGDVARSFQTFWDKYPLKDGKDLCCQLWLSVVTPESESAALACLSRYLASDQVARGILKSPRNWLHDAARDGWAADWPAANGKHSSSELIEELRADEED